MKILVVAPQPFYTERGTPIAVKLLVETLAQAGHAVDLLVYHQGADVSIPGVRLLRAGRPPLIGPVPRASVLRTDRTPEPAGATAAAEVIRPTPTMVPPL